MTKYQAIVRGGILSGERLLLGGVPTHKSTWFDTYADADKWRTVVVAGNREAGRVVSSSSIITGSGETIAKFARAV